MELFLIFFLKVTVEEILKITHDFFVKNLSVKFLPKMVLRFITNALNFSNLSRKVKTS